MDANIFHKKFFCRWFLCANTTGSILLLSIILAYPRIQQF